MKVSLIYVGLVMWCVLQINRAANAQFIATLDAGGSTVRDWSPYSYNAAVVNSSAQLIRTYTRFDGYATYESYGMGSWTGQGSLYATVYTPQKGLLSGELSFSGQGTLYNDGTRSGQAIGMLRGYLSNVKGGVWIGAGGGRSNGGFEGQNVLRGETGGWIQRKIGTFTATVTPIAIGKINYADIEAKSDLFLKKLDLSVLVGLRKGGVGSLPPGSNKVWLSVTPTFWMLPLVGISASAGSYPYDVAQNYPGARYLSVAIRIRSGIPPRSTDDTDKSSSAATLEEEQSGFLIVIKGNEKRLRIRADTASVVEITGSFTDWQPRQLVPVVDEPGWRGWWELDLSISSGIHQLNFRTDTGNWSIPKGMNIAEDEFNGKVGVLIVPD